MEILFSLGVPLLRWLESPKLIEFKAKGSRTKVYKGDQKCMCDRFLEKYILKAQGG